MSLERWELDWGGCFFNGQAFQATVVNVIDCNSSTFFRFFVETSGEHAR
jgi:hypothetical protein